MSTYFCEMVIFSLAISGSVTKSFPSLPSDVGIMNAKALFPVSILRFEVEVTIVEFEKLIVRVRILYA